MYTGGLETESEYPYEGSDDSCSFKKSEVRVYINDSLSLPTDEGKMAAWCAAKGPISIGINAIAMQVCGIIVVELSSSGCCLWFEFQRTYCSFDSAKVYFIDQSGRFSHPPIPASTFSIPLCLMALST